MWFRKLPMNVDARQTCTPLSSGQREFPQSSLVLVLVRGNHQKALWTIQIPKHNPNVARYTHPVLLRTPVLMHFTVFQDTGIVFANFIFSP